MHDPERHAFCLAFDTVARSVEIEVELNEGQKRLRLDVLRDEKSGACRVAAYAEETVKLERTYPLPEAAFGPSQTDFRVWVAYALPDAKGDSPDAALEAALNVLRDRAAKRDRNMDA